MSQIEFTKTFCQFRPMLLSFAFRLTKDTEAAQDLVQDTAYKAFKYQGTYKPHTNLRAWLMTIMRNTFINNYRQRKRRQVLDNTAVNSYLLSIQDGSARNEGEGSVAMEELSELVYDLDDWMKVPFLMHYQGFKYDEIATELDIPLGTVKSRIFFARKKLQEGLGRLYASRDLRELLN